MQAETRRGENGVKGEREVTERNVNGVIEDEPLDCGIED